MSEVTDEEMATAKAIAQAFADLARVFVAQGVSRRVVGAGLTLYATFTISTETFLHAKKNLESKCDDPNCELHNHGLQNH